MRIYTLTPNPALDLSGNVKSLIPNEKNYVTDERRDPGGNGINAARIAHRLGADTVALGLIGGATGDEIQSLLEKEGVRTQFTRIQAHTRVNVTVSNQQTHQQTRLTFPGPLVSARECQRAVAEVSKLKRPGLLILGGSLPAGCATNLHLRVGQAAAKRGLGVIVDVPAKYMKTLLSGFKPLLVKPNQTELEEWAGKKLRSDRALLQATLALARKSTLVCLSLADRGAILATGDHAWFAKAPKIKARGTVGAGDSMVGAMATQLARFSLTSDEAVRKLVFSADRLSQEVPYAFEEVLRWGLAAGAATAQSVGTAQARPADIHKLVPKVQIGRLSY